MQRIRTCNRGAFWFGVVLSTLKAIDDKLPYSPPASAQHAWKCAHKCMTTCKQHIKSWMQPALDWKLSPLLSSCLERLSLVLLWINFLTFKRSCGWQGGSMQSSSSSSRVPERGLWALTCMWQSPFCWRQDSSVKKSSPSSPAWTSGWGFLWLTAGLGLSLRNEIGLRVVCREREPRIWFVISYSPRPQAGGLYLGFVCLSLCKY